MTEFLAGAGRATIDIVDSILPVDGFGAALDPLEARVLVLQQRGRRIVLAVLDQTSIAPVSLSAINRLLVDATSVSPTDVLVGASHTFSAPHVVDHDQLQHALEAAVAAAAEAAVSGLRPARIGWGRGSAAVAVNRDVSTAAGWWLGANPARPSDPTVSVVRFEADDGAPIAVLINYAVQPSILNGSLAGNGRRLISADLAGAAVRHVEGSFGDSCVALFSIGAAGDQAPLLTAVRSSVGSDGQLTTVDAGEAGRLLVDLIGERLGSEAVRIGADLDCVAIDRMDLRREQVTVPRQVADPTSRSGPSTTYDFPADGNVDVPFWILRLGDLSLVGLQPELNCRTAMEIRRAAPNTVIMTMINGGAKYLPDREAYLLVTYEARNSWHAEGSAELVAEAIIRQLSS